MNKIIQLFISFLTLLPSVILGQTVCNLGYRPIIRQSQLDSFAILYPNCIELKSIRIFGNDITNLKALSGLKIIDNLEISSTRIKNLNDLKNVDTIRNFVFKLNHHIKSMDFYDRIQTSYLVISECDSLIEIINNPFYVLHKLSIYDNKSLKNINNLNITHCYSVHISGFTLDNLSLGSHTKTSVMYISKVKTLEGIQTFETNYLEMAYP